MKISTKGRYAVRMMLDIAEHADEGKVSLRSVSQRQDISEKYLEQIVSLLSKAGLLRSARGLGGGYSLVKKPSEYKIGDILRVTEGGLAPVTCLEEGADKCPRASSCATLRLWQGLYDTVTKYVDSVTLEDLLNAEGDASDIYVI